MSNWKSIKEEPPPDNVRIIACRRGDKNKRLHIITWFAKAQKEWHKVSSEEYTHWMLPKHIDEEEEA